MVKLIGKNKIDCAVFISGRGTNLKSIYKHSKKKLSKFRIKLVISDNNRAKGIIFTKKNKINFKYVKYKINKKSENQILNTLKKHHIKYIFLAGFMRILSKNFVNKYKNKIVNIHPSLLPKYKGLNTHKRAIDNKDKYSGCTVHFVTNKLDSGKIILQKKVRISKLDSPEKLAQKILKEENKIYPRALDKIFSSF